MKKFIKELYYMSLSKDTLTPIKDLVVSKTTGGVFNICVITEYMMKDFLKAQQFIDSIYERQSSKRNTT